MPPQIPLACFVGAGAELGQISAAADCLAATGAAEVFGLGGGGLRLASEPVGLGLLKAPDLGGGACRFCAGSIFLVVVVALGAGEGLLLAAGRGLGEGLGVVAFFLDPAAGDFPSPWTAPTCGSSGSW
jgi:hypothetical protein